jgi:titin
LVLGTGTSQNIVAGNYVGTDVTGKVALGNGGGYAAILIDGGATNNRVGASSADADPAGERNIISGNKDVGVEIYGAGSNPNLIAGNYIGTDVAGAAALGNANWGVWVGSGASDNTVGGTAAGARKVIAGNRGGGLGLIYSGTTGNQVLGNFIGTDAAGSASLPNSFYGVAVSGADNTIGGTAAGAGNLISGNGYVGVDIEGSGTTGNQILGNRIGTDACGTAALANPGWGVYIRDGASGNSVGGTAAGAGNTIAFNGTGGVVVFSGTGNSILANSVFANGGPGIDLGDDGVTLNGSRGQSGPNFYQVFPVLSSADISNGSATIQGSLTASPNTTYRVEFFANAAGDPSGYGEGQTFLGWAAVTTDGTGSASFTTTLPVPAGELVLTATATDPIGDTSEFSHWINPRPTTTGLSR